VIEVNPGLTKTYLASGPIPARAIVKAGGSEGTVAVATTSADAILGVAERLDVADGERVDVIHGGIAETVCGGNVAYGSFLTASNAGLAVTANPAAGVNAQVVGKALSAGAAGDIIDTLLTLGRIQG
jgi:hypothetical protein